MKVNEYSPILFNGAEVGAGAVPVAAPVADPAPVAEVPEGQGEATTSGLYSLDSVPEALRPQVEPLFKEWDANVTREFQKRSEAWAPYEKLGIRDVVPEDMEHLMAFYEIASDEDKFKEWLQATHASMFSEENPEAAPTGEPGADPAGADEDRPLTRAEAEALYKEQREAEAQEAEAQRIQDEYALEMRSTFDELGIGGQDEKSENLRDLVAFFAQKHQDGTKSLSEVLKAGWGEYQSMIGAAESDAIDKKLEQPTPAVTAGKPTSPPKQAETTAEAGERLKAKLRAARET